VRALLLGGTGLSGPIIGARLIERGHEVIVYHRGKHESKFLPPCEHIHGDRRDQEAFRSMLNRVSHSLK
jgi:nucleoside-diphosphate-sugar epimerase